MSRVWGWRIFSIRDEFLVGDIVVAKENRFISENSYFAAQNMRLRVIINCACLTCGVRQDLPWEAVRAAAGTGYRACRNTICPLARTLLELVICDVRSAGPGSLGG